MFESNGLLPVAGVIVGMVLGGVARWNHFCTLTSLERYWYGGNDRGIRTWVLAIAIAMATTQALHWAGILSLQDSFYLNPRLSLLGVILGGTLFGLGMALVGTCGFGALVRLGGGSMRSLIIVVAIGLAALMTQRGIIGRYREDYIEPLAIDLHQFGSQSFADIISSTLNLNLQALIASIVVAAMFFWLLSDAAFRRDVRALLTGTIVGLCVTAGWFVTEFFQEQSFEQVQIESSSFVLPPGELIYGLIATAGKFPDYGVGLVLGVVLGAALVALMKGDMRWEACDDARELNRHLIGAFLMGTGGILAGGCTIGQGVSAASTLAISAPIAFASMLLGARIGLRLLIEGRSLVGSLRW